jgi:sugar phosphate permease
MNNKTKDGYLVAVGFIIVGFLILYASGWKIDLTFFVGVGCVSLGLAGFKWPIVAELLVHWAKKQEQCSKQSINQTQKNTKDSNQILNTGGTINIFDSNKKF